MTWPNRGELVWINNLSVIQDHTARVAGSCTLLCKSPFLKARIKSGLVFVTTRKTSTVNKWQIFTDWASYCWVLPEFLCNLQPILITSSQRKSEEFDSFIFILMKWSHFLCTFYLTSAFLLGYLNLTVFLLFLSAWMDVCLFLLSLKLFSCYSGNSEFFEVKYSTVHFRGIREAYYKGFPLIMYSAVWIKEHDRLGSIAFKRSEIHLFQSHWKNEWHLINF